MFHTMLQCWYRNIVVLGDHDDVGIEYYNGISMEISQYEWTYTNINIVISSEYTGMGYVWEYNQQYKGKKQWNNHTIMKQQ